MASTITHTIKNSGGDYTTLVAWESAQQRDLPGDDEIAVAECYNDFGGYLTTSLNVTGWTTDATRYIKIYAPSGQRHNGTAGTGFRITHTTSAALYIQEANVEIEAIEIKMTSSGHPVVWNNADAGWASFHHCLVHGDNAASYVYVVYTNAGMALSIYNCFFYGMGRGTMVHTSAGSPDIFCYNNSYWGCQSYNIVGNVSANIVVKNCVSAGASTADTSNVAYFHADSDYNAGGNALVDSTRMPGTNNQYEIAGADNYTNTGSGTEDLHIKDTNADIYATGVDLDPDPDGNLNVTDDIDYTSRSEWSIGGDEVGVQTLYSTFTIDALVAVRTTDTFTADAIIQGAGTDTATIDTIIQSAEEDDSTLDALVAIRYTDDFTIDAIILETKTDDVTLDAWIANRYTDDFTIDAVVAVRYTNDVLADAIILETKTDDVTLDAFVAIRYTATFTMDVIIVSTFTIDAEIFDSSSYNSLVIDVDTHHPLPMNIPS
jgi:hypothetical protein